MLNIGINEIITKNLKLESINKIWVIFLIFLYCLVINGCYTAYYSTQTDPQIIFKHKAHKRNTKCYRKKVCLIFS